MPLGPTVKQITVLLANRAGALASVTDLLRDHQVNIRAFHLANAGRTGFVQLICEPHDRAFRALQDSFRNYVLEADALVVLLDDQSGALASLLAALSEAEVNISQSYIASSKSENTAVVIEPESQGDLKRAIEMLMAKDFTLADSVRE